MKLIYDYEYLLQRALTKLPKKTITQAYDIPPLAVEYIGKHTVVTNLKAVSERLRRDPRLIMRFFLKSTGKPGAVNDKGQLEIYDLIKKESLDELYKRFLNTYVRCSTCGSYDTELIRHGKIWYIKCLACGAETFVNPI